MKKKLAGLALAALMGTAVVGTLTAHAALENYGADYLEDVKAKGTLVVGCDPTIEGVCYLDPVTNEYTGFIPTIIEGFAEQIGCEVQWETLEWSAMLTAVNSGKVDMIAANMNMTLERESQIVFSDPYFIDHGKGLVTVDSDLNSLEDAGTGEGQKIGVTEGSAYEDLIPELFPDAEVVTLSQGTWQDALETGIITMAFDDGVVFAGPLAKNDNLKLLEGNGPSYLNGCAFAAGNYVMADVFNLYLKRIKISGDYADIYAEYMGSEWVPETVVSAY